MFAILALLVGTLSILINPITNSNVYADWQDATTGGGTTNTTPTISLSLGTGDNGKLEKEITSTDVSNGTTVATSTTLDVTYSNIDAYYIAVNTENGHDGRLVGQTYPGFQIGGVGNNVSASSFNDNTWGYAIGGENADIDTLNYNTVPEFSKPMIANKYTVTKSTTANTDKYKLAFAAKLGSDAPSDHYIAHAYISATINTGDVVLHIDNITNMQEMTNAVCDNSYETESKQLIDSRDAKSYWVTKLKDGNCWMTQNLDLDLSSSVPLTSQDSDIETNWTPNTTISNKLNDWNTNSDPNAIASFDPGNYYYKLESDNTWTNCYQYALSSFSSCKDKANWSENIPYEGGEHYHVGNYYTWGAATAGTGSSIESGQATGSICPKGWKLPQSDASLKTGSFGKLSSAYHLNDNAISANAIRKAPFYFIPAGSISTGGNLGYVGLQGHYRSATATSIKQAYHLYFGSGSIIIQASNDRQEAYPIRCVNDPNA